MLKRIISIVPAALLSVTVGANVQAATITVQKGDTLWDLSRANNTTVENIQTLNHLATDRIHPGDVLTIAQPTRYTVKQGDTLWEIANNYRVTISQIKEWNQLHTDVIHPGLKLSIYEGLKPSKTVATTQDIKESKPDAIAPSTTAEPTNSSTSKKVTKENKTEASAPSVDSKKDTAKATAPSTSKSDTNEITVEATAYTASCEGCSGITATGINLKENPNAKVISVDPTVIPLGSKVYVEGYGEAIAGDTGGSIKGNKIDVFVPSQQDAVDFGVKQLQVKILD